MLTFKNRFSNQKIQILDNFEANFPKICPLLSQDEKNRLKSFSDQIETEIYKGIAIGASIGLFFYINMRKNPVFSLQKKICYTGLPLIVAPLYYYFSYMEKFRTFELYLALKISESQKPN